jgi:ribosomal protein S18 acetylase RimI-like enzyme
MGSLRFRRVFNASSIGEPSLPAGFAMRRFVPVLHAREARALLNDSYATGAGQVQSFDAWWAALQADAEYDPDLCFVAEDAETNALAAFAVCWTSAFVKDIAVSSVYRRRGLGRAMIGTITSRLAARGFGQLTLKVVPENISAIAFYRALGFEPAEE